MAWNFSSDRPIYIQLIDQIELFIFSGTYPPGAKLPSVRDLAKEAAVNPNTMQRALAKLEEDGLIVTHRTSGRTITEDVAVINTAKKRFVQKQIEAFIANMRLLGFDQEEIVTNITQLLKEMKP